MVRFYSLCRIIQGMTRILLIASSLLVFVSPLTASAHTRWFAEGTLPPFVTNEPTMIYLSAWALVTIVVVLCGIWMERLRILTLNFLKPKVPHAFDRAASTFSMVAGAFLMIAGTHEYLFSPNLSHDAGIPMTLVMLQFVIGLAMLLGIFARVAALALMALWALGVMTAGWLPMIEDIWVLSTAAFIFIMGNDYFSIVSYKLLKKHAKKYHAYALPLLRMGTGTTLIVLGFSEKILHPEFGINFLSSHHWNFMQLLGVTNYSDYLFTLSAGSVEALFGLIFILGIMTRLNALVAACFFTIPLFILGPIELAGHVPHFAAVVVILLFGAGEKWRLVHVRR